MSTAADTAELGELEQRGEYAELIAGLRERIEADPRVLTDGWVKEWCGRRWRNLFVSAATEDPAAVSTAAKRVSLPGTDLSLKTGHDDRSDRQQVAERFLKRNVDEWQLEMPGAQVDAIDSGTLVFCPGLINSMLPIRAFSTAFPAVAEEHGWRVICSDAHPMRDCEANVDDLLASIERGMGLDANCEPIAADGAEPPGDVFLVGYSKGIPDALTLLVKRPDLAPRVKALFGWGGAFGGSFLADDIYESIKDLEIPLGSVGDVLGTVIKTVFPIVRLDGVSERLDEYDVKGAIRDLTTPVREQFLADHAEEIDALDVPIFNITAATTALEVPFFQVQGYMEVARRDPDNDMQVTQDQARMQTPMATDLAVLRAHHWDISYDPFPVHTRLGSPNLDHRFPRQAAITGDLPVHGRVGAGRLAGRKAGRGSEGEGLADDWDLMHPGRWSIPQSSSGGVGRAAADLI